MRFVYSSWTYLLGCATEALKYRNTSSLHLPLPSTLPPCWHTIWDWLDHKNQRLDPDKRKVCRSHLHIKRINKPNRMNPNLNQTFSLFANIRKRPILKVIIPQGSNAFILLNISRNWTCIVEVWLFTNMEILYEKWVPLKYYLYMRQCHRWTSHALNFN